MLQPPNNAPDVAECLVAVGANLPSPAGSVTETVSVALGLLADEFDESLVISRLYVTPAFPAGSGPDYVNAALCGMSSRSPQELLAALHAIEARFGRTRHKRWESRVLDLDLLACGNMVLPDPTTLRSWMDMPLAQQQSQAPEQLLLPHPRMHQRGFVLVPLLDVAPDWRHPLLGRTVREMLRDLPAAERDGIRMLAHPPEIS